MYQEPPLTPDDTRPTTTVPMVKTGTAAPRSASGGQRIVGALSVLGALGFTVATALILLSSGSNATLLPDQTNNGVSVAQLTALPSNTPAPTSTPDSAVTAAPLTQAVFSLPEIAPTLDGSTLVVMLSAPVEAVGGGYPQLIARGGLNPFTIIPDRPRNQIIEYTIERGDTVYEIAQKFGLQEDSIAWSNDRRQLWTLIPGDKMLIPPVDGVIHIVAGQDTIGEITALYGVDDPLPVIDSEFNQLRGYTPDTVPPSGMKIFIAGGTGENINWAPPIVQGTSGGGAGGTGGDPNTVMFDPSSPGSCGAQPIGGASGWASPIFNATVTRGYTDYHPGIDLAANPGTPVFAANSGRVIFAGWSNWGYGNAIVISHGPFQTLYGHLSSVNVRCGDTVVAGQGIGGVGSTGNSSGPHLHFELMYNGIRGNPAATLSF